MSETEDSAVKTLFFNKIMDYFDDLTDTVDKEISETQSLKFYGKMQKCYGILQKLFNISKDQNLNI